MTLLLHPGSVAIETLERLYWNEESARLDPACDAAIVRSAARIAQIAGGSEPVYGINTGFGKLASVRIAPGDVETLQRNLILSHCCGVGAPLERPLADAVSPGLLPTLGRAAPPD